MAWNDAGLAAAALVGGLLVAAQGPIYARLAAALANNSLAAAFLAFFTATICLGLVVLASGAGRLQPPALAKLPFWVWLGGLFGAYQVIVSMTAVPRLGATLFIMLVVVGNMLGAALYDHFSMFGLERRPLSAGSLLGVGLAVLGVLIKARSRFTASRRAGSDFGRVGWPDVGKSLTGDRQKPGGTAAGG